MQGICLNVYFFGQNTLEKFQYPLAANTNHLISGWKGEGELGNSSSPDIFLVENLVPHGKG